MSSPPAGSVSSSLGAIEGSEAAGGAGGGADAAGAAGVASGATGAAGSAVAGDGAGSCTCAWACDGGGGCDGDDDEDGSGGGCCDGGCGCSAMAVTRSGRADAENKPQWLERGESLPRGVAQFCSLRPRSLRPGCYSRLNWGWVGRLG